MTAIAYTAKDRFVGGRSALASGHTAGAGYTLDTAAHTLDRWENEEVKKSTALDGSEESLLQRIDEGFDVLTDIVELADQAYWLEFFSSVRASESFTFDAFGTTATPNDARNAVLDGKPKERRVESSRRVQYQFRIRFVA